MKNRLTYCLQESFLFVLFLIASIVLAFFSWIGSIYGLDVQNLLSAEGVRWGVSHLTANFKQVPFADLLLMLLTISMLVESGLFIVFRKRTSLKQRRALQLSTLLLAMGVLLLLLAAFVPHSILLSCWGTYQGSAIQQGLYPLLMLLVMLVAAFYGYLSGTFSSLTDVLRGATRLPALMAPSLPVLFVSSQLMGSINYVFADLADHSVTQCILYFIFFWLPPLMAIGVKRRE